MRLESGMTLRQVMVIAGALGFLAVLAGTFGAHTLRGRVEEDLMDIYEVGVRYHAYHALAILACAGLVDRLGRGGRVAILAFALGVVVFSGSLYALALTGQRWLGAVTPFGGVALLVGWGALATAGWRRSG